MSKIDMANVTNEDIQETLNDLLVTGAVFASCPNCRIYISCDELKKSKCLSCKKKFKVLDVLYFPNETIGQNN